MIVTENRLDDWVRANAIVAQGLVVELVYRLVAASSPRPKERRFPLGDSIGQHGPDGVLDVEFPYDPFIPQGRSYWEIGTNLDAGAKATSDYTSLTADIPEEVRKASTFVFVTPHSGRRDWEHTWKENSQIKWLAKRKGEGKWLDVRVFDGTKLIDWLRQFPTVELWLAQQMGLPAEKLELPEQRWEILKLIGSPPPLLPTIFLINRELAKTKLSEIFDQKAVELKLDTHFPDQVGDFVSAYIAGLDDDKRVDATGRCLIVRSSDAWNAIADHKERLVFVADFPLDEQDSTSVRLVEKARRSGHAIIMGGRPGGIPHPNRAAIPNPSGEQVRQALEQAGYGEERARTLSQKSGGNLGFLLRCLHNLSLSPAWAESSAAAELVIAELLGSWNDGVSADRTAAEGLLPGKTYGEWIERMRNVALEAGAPLVQRDGNWTFIARYEGWYALGPRLFDDHLQRLRTVAVTVLNELDPQLELPSKERLTASIQGKKLKHSASLRHGIAETLALLNGHSKALTSVSFGKADETTILAVRAILANADWIKWASLNDVLPLLAEASPREFLAAVEMSLEAEPCPFGSLFAQEDSGIGGSNYLTGLLWGLETLAWSEELLTRVTVILGDLATIDPGGNWANRPAESLQTIFMPWLPQTCASVPARQTAISTLLDESPSVGWKLLLNLLPQSHQSSMGSRRPEWLELIPSDWKAEVSEAEYRDQATAYSELAVAVAQNDVEKLCDLIPRLPDLPMGPRDQLISHLGSNAILNLPEIRRNRLWDELVSLATKHKKFSYTDWALNASEITQIEAVANDLAPKIPTILYQRLFSNNDFDLLEETGSYEEQAKKLQETRDTAVREIIAAQGVEVVPEFALSVESPWRVGQSLGIIESAKADNLLLPDFLTSDNTSALQFVGAFAGSRVRTFGWGWADQLNRENWTPAATGRFLIYMPFNRETWQRVEEWLKVSPEHYWSNVQPQLFEAQDDAEDAIEALISFQRPHAAIQLLYFLQHQKRPFRIDQAIRALALAPTSSEVVSSMTGYHIVGLIEALQSDPQVNIDDLLRIEWLYLRLLTGRESGTAKTIQRQLSTSPKLFGEVIRLIYYPKGQKERPSRSKQEAENGRQAFRLLEAWTIPPGLQDDGTFDGKAFANWLREVKEECKATGHLEVALISVGRVLTFSPPDPDGLWIHRAVASALNARDAGDMRRGFANQLFNSRGVFGFSKGEDERRLAQSYRTKGQAVETAGFHRLATTLRDLADGYDRDAERDATRGSQA